MTALIACVVKELRLLGRDVHGLALLFILPLVFILVMSLALQDVYAARGGRAIDVLVIDRDGSDAAKALMQRLADNGAFRISQTTPLPSDARLKERLRAGEFSFAVDVSKTYGATVLTPPQPGAPPLLTVIVAPDASKQTEAIFLGVLREAVGRQRLDLLLQRVGAGGGDQAAGKAQIVTTYAFARETPPTAVQQNVPAWLVFAIFFVAIPFSNTFVRERELGAHRRLRTTNVSPVTQFFGKLIPYFAINQLQVALMLAVGVFLVPLLGGEALQIRGAPEALVLLSAAVSLAALGLALLIAVAARTTEQATMLSGLGNIVLAAIGGIMVPKFVMPAAMQDVAAWSPMAWGLDGFLDLLLRDGDTAAIAPELFKLGGFGAVALVAAWLIYRVRD